MSKFSDHKLIIGDFNVTINHLMDSKGYLTDPHTKSRDVITNWLLNGYFCDSYRDTHPDKLSYTYRTKDFGKSARQDYALASPELMNRITEVKHIANRYEVTDHSTLMLKLTSTKLKAVRASLDAFRIYTKTLTTKDSLEMLSKYFSSQM